MHKKFAINSTVPLGSVKFNEELNWIKRLAFNNGYDEVFVNRILNKNLIRLRYQEVSVGVVESIINNEGIVEKIIGALFIEIHFHKSF